MTIFIMLYRLPAFAAACLLSVTTLAQTEAENEGQVLRTSIVAGIGANQIDGDAIKGYDKPGMIVGGAARFALAKKVFFQPEVLYIQKGSRSGENFPGFIRWRVNYVEIPVLLTWQFLPKFTLLGGAGAAYLLGAQADENGAGMVVRTNEFNKLDLLWIAGLEYALGDKWAVNMRMEYSLVPANKQAPSFYNNTIALTLRYHLGN